MTEPDGTVTALPPTFTPPKPRPITIEVKSFKVIPGGEVLFSWWAKIDRHPYSDKQGYADADEARAAAVAWVTEHFGDREIEGESDGA